MTQQRHNIRMRYARRRGCGVWILAAGAVMAMAVLTCIFSLVLYLVFPPAPLDILVMGLDSRPDEGNATRTDSIMLMGVGGQHGRLALLSIPRDLFIEVPDYGKIRINTVNVLAEIEDPGSGPGLLASAIETNFGVRIDRYVRLNFQAFRELIDSVGGVTLEVPYRLVDTAFPAENGGIQTVVFEPGQQHMDGARALIYARVRHPDDDYARAARQQQVIEALAQKLLNPLVWPGALAAITRHMETNLTPGDLLALIPAGMINLGRFERVVIDRDYISAGPLGAEPNYAALQPWIAAHYD